ncbi:dehydrogenase of unknown specificity, short-chain alcohol dehydrogenase like [Corynebacterium mustelae]|uniref:Short-chain alcohol dehydrogenase n=1 Tax=Corynebacterium mustelae TaxID=571915 RepID=A0A0G3H5U8_9CORY|nr:SDR family NAD(P)-dependent oxidoreductase [Corynebacterium mustelae]AKK07203.1 dehydrogenase of unknown specificity, short-chain alcohol dehydrogenase like [Corynebacterium mustelae]
MVDYNSQERVWLFSGISSGLGREWALAVLRQGDKVVGITRQPDSVSDIESAFPGQFFSIKQDIRNYPLLEQALNSALQEHKLPYISHVVCAAAFAHFGTIEDVSPDDLEASFRVNVVGSRNVAIAGLRAMPSFGDRRIIFVSSMSGLHCWPNLGTYQITKYGVRALSETLRIELAEFGIQVGCLYPGPHIGTGWATSYAERTPSSSRYNDLWLQENCRCGFELYDTESSVPLFDQMINESPMPRAGTGHDQVTKLFELDSQETLKELLRFGSR